MKAIGSLFFVALLVLAGFVGLSALYIVQETDQVILTRFGKVIGEPAADAGLHFKAPFIDQVNRLEKRVMEWDGTPISMPTKDKTFIRVDTFGRWRIADPILYFTSLERGNELNAQNKINDILRSETLNAIAKHELIEAVRSTPGREPEIDESLKDVLGQGLRDIKIGRAAIEEQITKNAKSKLVELGIELLDVRFKRVNYNPEVLEKIQNRMISERLQIAERFRSEGQGEAAEILGAKEKDLLEISSEAYKQEQTIRGGADAEATQIYADAYDSSREAADFYQFLKTMEIYETIIHEDDTIILSTDSDLFESLKGLDPSARAPMNQGTAMSDELPLFLRDN
ncbi:MAG: protease modulator HflC [Verrucomicrobiota bacterium]